ncbi:MAG TPA: flagellar FliJ family protein [Telluria sp.]|jgi:flagellar biosynthesis chaperone FliJ
MSKRFRYALQPVLLARTWALDALKLELGERNASLGELQQQRAAIEQESAAVNQSWQQQSSVPGNFNVDGFATVIAYLGQLAGYAKRKDEQIALAARERDELIDRIVAEQRGVEAVEEHRDKMFAEFRKEENSVQFKAADDHWSTLHGREQDNGMEKHEQQF